MTNNDSHPINAKPNKPRAQRLILEKTVTINAKREGHIHGRLVLDGAGGRRVHDVDSLRWKCYKDGRAE